MKFWLRDFNIPHFTAFQAIFTLYTELWTSKLVKIGNFDQKSIISIV